MTFISNPTGRNTKAYIVTLDNTTELFFSYETLIAVRQGAVRKRLANHWGPTTGRHFNELGCRDFEIVAKLPPITATLAI